MRISDWSSDVCFRSSFAAPVVVDEGEAVQGRPDVALDDKQAWVAWLREDASGQSLWLARYAPDLSRELSRTQVAALQGRGRGTGFPKLVARNGEAFLDRKSVVLGKSVSVRVDLGGRRSLKKKNKRTHNSTIKET